MYKTLLIIIYLFIAQSSVGATFNELQKIPYDSAHIENMRIWIPVETNRCQVKVKILDDQMKEIRLLLDQTISKGYYNIYWDKKDTASEYVPEGTYKVAIIAGAFRRIEDIHVQYVDGENSALLTTSKDMKNPFIHLKLLNDSLRVSLEILNARKNHTDSLFVDSLIVGDSVSFVWRPDSAISLGRYFYKLQINDFEHLIEFRYKR